MATRSRYSIRNMSCHISASSKPRGPLPPETKADVEFEKRELAKYEQSWERDCPSPTFGKGTKRARDDSDDDMEMPPMPVELIVLANELMAIGQDHNLGCPHTLLKVEELCAHFWNTWWSK